MCICVTYCLFVHILQVAPTKSTGMFSAGTVRQSSYVVLELRLPTCIFLTLFGSHFCNLSFTPSIPLSHLAIVQKHDRLNFVSPQFQSASQRCCYPREPVRLLMMQMLMVRLEWCASVCDVC